MCDITRIGALIIAAEVAALVAFIIILSVVGTSGTIFTAFLSPPFMIAASISLAVCFICCQQQRDNLLHA